jgi:hypothetical protein
MAAQPRMKRRPKPANVLPFDDPAPSPPPGAKTTAPQRAARKKKINFKRVFGLTMLLVGVGMVAFPTFLMLICGMAPTLVAIVVQERHIPYRVRTIGLCNFAGVMPQISLVWQHGHHIDAATRLLADPYVWATMYIGAAGGLLLLWAGPIIAAAIYYGMAAQRRRAFDGYRKKLIEEWGDGIIAANDQTEPAGDAKKSV